MEDKKRMCMWMVVVVMLISNSMSFGKESFVVSTIMKEGESIPGHPGVPFFAFSYPYIDPLSQFVTFAGWPNASGMDGNYRISLTNFSILETIVSDDSLFPPPADNHFSNFSLGYASQTKGKLPFQTFVTSFTSQPSSIHLVLKSTVTGPTLEILNDQTPMPTLDGKNHGNFNFIYPPAADSSNVIFCANNDKGDWSGVYATQHNFGSMIISEYEEIQQGSSPYQSEERNVLIDRSNRIQCLIDNSQTIPNGGGLLFNGFEGAAFANKIVTFFGTHARTETLHPLHYQQHTYSEKDITRSYNIHYENKHRRYRNKLLQKLRQQPQRPFSSNASSRSNLFEPSPLFGGIFPGIYALSLDNPTNITVCADYSTQVPGSTPGDTFMAFSTPSIDLQGKTIGFLGLSKQQVLGIYSYSLATHQLTVVADTNTVVPPSTLLNSVSSRPYSSRKNMGDFMNTFGDFEQPSVYNGRFAFFAETESGIDSGIYVEKDDGSGELENVVSFEKYPDWDYMGMSEVAFDGTNMAFYVLQDWKTAICVARIVKMEKTFSTF